MTAFFHKHNRHRVQKCAESRLRVWGAVGAALGHWGTEGQRVPVKGCVPLCGHKLVTSVLVVWCGRRGMERLKRKPFQGVCGSVVDVQWSKPLFTTLHSSIGGESSGDTTVSSETVVRCHN